MPSSRLARQLTRYQIPCTLRAAGAFLETLRESIGLLHLYQEFFPAEFAASTADRHRTPDTSYSASEWELFTLVDAHLFPVDLDWLEAEEERTLVSPLMNLGFDREERLPTEFTPGWQMLLVLAGEAAIADTDPANHPYGALPILAGILRPAALQVTNWPAFVALCQAAPLPLNAVPLALAMIWHETGNIWLDTDPDSGDTVIWTPHGLRQLAAAYTAAQAWIDRTETLITWLEEAPAHLEEVIHLWNLSLTAIAA